METAPAPTWQAQFESAGALFAAGEFADAEAAYRLVMTAAPRHLPAYIGASRCARKRGDRAASLACFDAAAITHPTHAGVQMERAADLQALQRLDDAQDVYRSVIALAPGNMQAHLGLGQCARQRGDRAAAIAVYQAAAEAVPGNPWPLVEMAGSYRELGQLDEAEARYFEVLLLARDNVQAWLGLGQCARKRGNRLLAFAHFQAGSLAAPTSPWPLLETAVDLRELGRVPQAEDIYRQVLAIAPDQVQAHLGLGHCARKRGDREAAMIHVRAAIRAAPADPWPLLDLAADLRELGRIDAAADACRQALAIAPHNTHAHIGLAQCARKRGDRLASLAVFQSAVAASPADWGLRIELAADLRELGQLDAADAQCRHVLAAVPDHVQAHIGLGQGARKRGDRLGSLAIFRSAVAAVPADPSLRIELAANLRELGQLDEAEAAYRQALAVSPGHVQGHLGLGFCARAGGDRTAALAHFRTAIRAQPHDTAPWLEIAFEQREAGDPDAAIRTARDVLALHPTNLSALLSVGITERHAGRHRAALAAFAAAHDAHPGHAEPLVEMAVEARSLGRQAECDERLAQARAVDPRHATVIVRLAEQAMMANDIDGAEAIYQQAVLDQPGNLHFQLGAVEAMAASGEIGAALECLQALEQGQGPSAALIGKRLGLLRRSGENLAALRLARDATEAAPHHFQHWVERFQCEMLVGSDAEIDACLARIRPDTAHRRALVTRFRGNAAESRWHLSEAIGQYDAAAALDALDAGIQHDLVRARILMLDLAGARQHLRRFCECTAHVTRLKGASLNLSQTHYGQIIDDYCLDAPLLAALGALQPLPPAERAAAVSRLVRDNPDHTAASVSLMVALRQAGAFAPVADDPAAVPGGIGNRVTQFWDADVPADVAAIMQSWRRLNPDFRFQLFNDSNARLFLMSSYPAAVLAAYRRVKEPAQKADIFRLAWLAAEGGIYIDADDRCLQPLGAILPGQAGLVVYQEDHATLGNNFIAARPRHPVLLRALQLAVTAINRGDTDVVWLSTGPALLTRAFAQILVEDPAWNGGLPSGTVVLDRRELFRAVAIHCAAGYKKTERHWSNTAFARRRRAAEGTTRSVGGMEEPRNSLAAEDLRAGGSP